MILTGTTSSFEQLEEGLHPAVCTMIVGIGTQRTPFTNEDGTPKVQKQMIVQWETAQGFIAKTYTASLHEKANLRKDLEGWRGKKFTEEELAGFDTADILGKQCTVQVMDNKNGYPTVSAVLPKTGDFKTRRALLTYEVAEHDEEVFQQLPAWVQKKIENCIENMGNEPVKSIKADANTWSDGTPLPEGGEDEPIPF